MVVGGSGTMVVSREGGRETQASSLIHMKIRSEIMAWISQECKCQAQAVWDQINLIIFHQILHLQLSTTKFNKFD